MEILMVIAMIIILAGTGLWSYYSERSTSAVMTAAGGVAATLEQARSDAMAGKGGENWGVHFTGASYSYFGGPTYNPSDPGDRINILPAGLALSATLSSGSYDVVFSRLSGLPQATGTVTISSSGGQAVSKAVQVDDQGNISVIQ